MRWKLVPTEPTEEMLGSTTKFVRKQPLQQRAARAAYVKMLAAAPPAGQDEALVERAKHCVAGFRMEDAPFSDNLAIAIRTYFSDHQERPDNDEDDDGGWSPWVRENCERVLNGISRAVLKMLEGGE